MLSVAAFEDGIWAQAFPSFGSERMGAPVTAFCRLDEREIRNREPVSAPDALIVQDPTLLHQIKVFEGLAPTGYVLINSVRSPGELGISELLETLPPGHTRTIAATEIAMRVVGRPVPNAALLGALCAMTGRVKLASIEKAIGRKFKGEVGDRNVAAAREAYELCGGAITKGAARDAQAV